MSNWNKKNGGGLVIISYDDSVYFDNAAWDESRIMMYIKQHSFSFSSSNPPAPTRPHTPFRGLMTVLWETSLGEGDVEADKHQLKLIAG